MVIIRKEIGETPLQALERYRADKRVAADIPMTYAGRLDPMAEGELLILVGDECKEKERYLGLDKEYEVEILFGVSTDSYDALGMSIPDTGLLYKSIVNVDWSRYVGKSEQPYPPYSSKTVDGVQLHSLARKGELPEEMPTKKVEIYSIDFLTKVTIKADELKARVFKGIDLVKGDFRQELIKTRWGDVLTEPDREFHILKIRVKCSSGTYMRSLAHTIGKDLGTGAFALSINRTKIFL